MNHQCHGIQPTPPSPIKLPSAEDLRIELARLEGARYPWLRGMAESVPEGALRHLQTAMDSYARGRARFPRFKSRKRGEGSFTIVKGTEVNQDRVLLRPIGWVRLKEKGYIPSRERILSATVSWTAGRWFVAVNVVEKHDEPRQISGPVVGVDRGLISLFVASDGMVVENPRALKRRERKLKRLERALSRKMRGSRNREKAVAALRRKHYHIACTRLDVIHKATTKGAPQFSLK